MSKPRIVAVTVVALAGITQATDTELESLKTRVAEIENQQHQKTIDATILDTQSRNELLKADGFTAGWDKGFKIGSADGNYLLQFYGVIQIRNVTNASNGFFFEDQDDDDDQTINGFEIRRTKAGIRGNVIDSRLGYDFRMAFLRSGGSELEVAYLTWRSTHEWTLKAGQYKANWTHEENVADVRQLTAERSMLNAAICGGTTEYVQGVAAMYTSKGLRAEFGFSDGAESGNTPWNGELPTGYDFGVEGRAEFKFGDAEWSAYDDFTAIGNKKDAFVIGAGFDWSSGSDNATGDGYDLRHTIDIQWENTSGLSLYAAYAADLADSGDDESYHWGFLAQAGYLFGDTKWEAFVRYNYFQLDDLPDGVEDEYHEITGGVNYYFFNSHAFKFTCDLNYLPNGAVGGTGGLGYVTDDEEQWALRAQLQIQI